MISLSSGDVTRYVEARIPGAKLVNGEFRAPCPIHGGKDPNFAIKAESGQCFCHSQCGRGWDLPGLEQELSACDFQAALDNIESITGRTFSNGHSSPAPVSPSNHRQLEQAQRKRDELSRQGFHFAAEFYYRDDLRKVRFEHSTKVQAGKNRAEKTFRWEHARGGAWFTGDGGLDKPAYLNQAFRDREVAGRVIGFEGEAKSDFAGELGFPAFSFKELSEESAAVLIDWDVVLWPDADPAGVRNASAAAQLVAKSGARSVAIATPPKGLPEAGDIIDAVRTLGWTAQDVSKLIEGARPAGSNRLVVLSLDDILKLDVPEPSMLIEGVLTDAAASLLVAAAKTGKTLIAVQMAIAVASGSALFANYRVMKPGPVLVIEQDDPSGGASVKAILQRSPVPVQGIPFRLVERGEYEFNEGFIELLEREIRRSGLRLVVLDSYTALRGARPKGIDIVKVEQQDLVALDEMAKRTGCAVVVIHHSSKGSAGLDWSEKAAGTYAMSAATESQIFISRYPELEIAATERLLRVRGRHTSDLEMVLRFRKETLDFEHVLEGGAASVYPLLQMIQRTFGVAGFSPKDLSHETGVSKATAHRQIDKLYHAGALRKRSFGEYVVAI